MRNRIEIIILFIGIICASVYYGNKFQQEKKVHKNSGYIVGKIVDYYVIFPKHHYLDYEYNVKGIKYFKSTSVEMKYRLHECAEDKSCIGASIPIVYELGRPENSIPEWDKIQKEYR